MRVWSSWDRLHNANFRLQGRKEHQFISVIIVGRNEENSIVECLSSVDKNKYPSDRYEIIYVDDHSTDDTVKHVSELGIHNLKILNLSDYIQESQTTSFKKHAVQFALSKSEGEIIACTDADCIVPSNWLANIDFAMQQALIKMLVMPICFKTEKSIINRFQSLDMMATMAFTGYGIESKLFYSANGANMAFRKASYELIDIKEEYASGDDIFLIQALSKLHPDGIKFLKSKAVIVKTKAESSWKHLYEQRKRWVTKSKGYTKSNLYKIQVKLFLFNIIIVLNLILGLTLNSLFLFIALFQLLIKGIMDYLLLNNMSSFFNQNKSLKWFIVSFLIFTPYLILMGVLANFGNRYIWKDRKVQ